MHGGIAIYSFFVFSFDSSNGLRVGGVILNTYLLRVLGAVILSALLTAILPSGKTSPLIVAVTRLLCVLAIVAPVFSFLKKGMIVFEENNYEDFFSDSVIERQESFIEYYSYLRIQETEEALERELYERYAIDSEVVLSYTYERESMSDNYQEDDIKITKIIVSLEEETNKEVIQSMWEYLTKQYCREVLIEERRETGRTG